MNFQNIPRSDKVIKQAFVPKLDAFLFFDYKQIEPRLLAYYLSTIGDDSLAHEFRSGVDVYTHIVQRFYNKSELTDEERQTGKVQFLSMMYGGSERTITHQFGISWPEAEAVVNRFHRAWPTIGRPIKGSNGRQLWPPQYKRGTLNGEIQARIKERGYITTLFGRHLHPESGHKAINMLIQGCAADLMRRSLVDVAQMLKDSRCSSHLVSVIHDELIIDASMDEVPLLVKRVPPAMDYPLVSEVVPILVDVEISTTTWADKTTYQEVCIA